MQRFIDLIYNCNIIRDIRTQITLDFLILLMPYFLIIGILCHLTYQNFFIYCTLSVFAISAFYAKYKQDILQKLILITSGLLTGAIIIHLHILCSTTELLANSEKVHLQGEIVCVKTHIKNKMGEIRHNAILKPISITKNSKSEDLLKSIKYIKLSSNKPIFTGDIIEIDTTLKPISNTSYQPYERIISKLSGISCKCTIIHDKLSRNKYEKLTFIQKVRIKIHQNFLKQLGQINGGIASALITGISEETAYIKRDFSQSGLAHLLAISGLHMSIIASIVFFIFHTILMPFFMINSKRFAGIISIICTSIYSLLSGGSISAIRAFLMTSFIFVGIIFHRKTILVRNISVAASIILWITPLSLMNPGFVLSFAAVIGLASISRSISTKRNITSYTKEILSSSLASTFATALYTVFFFKQFTLYGIISNIIAIPLTISVIMPLCIVTLVLSLFCTNPITIYPLDISIDILRKIASFVANLHSINFEYYSISGAEVLFFTFVIFFVCFTKSLYKIPITAASFIVLIYNNFHQPISIIEITNDKIVQRNKYGKLSFKICHTTNTKNLQKFLGNGADLIIDDIRFSLMNEGIQITYKNFLKIFKFIDISQFHILVEKYGDNIKIVKNQIKCIA
ncbi:ComEC/Rec2 family competence protein [Candidatus Gromoviella agglomerans]|uniref:ComEC/Rec2 family competence protein n=1 Tax=Candidatus Gromoviella agglomerans TaxID=2806609 RepID=UPI001E621927|nr:ComEC/Rec2 family competence protein [Candidatus Gromoviella agglomerans]UFX98535.1 ComEC/Rec2 family competence protein [Candidatus Gromoviella agglomerans]